MPPRLTDTQVEQYRRDGFCGPVPVMTTAEAQALRAELEEYEQADGKKLAFPDKSKPYLVFNWADTLVHHPAALDAVQDVIGPDILVYHTTVWIKEPHTDARVLWHQDDAYFNLDPAEQVTAWVALSDASELAGCMRMIPGSHRGGRLIDHNDRPVAESLVRRGQTIGEHLTDSDGTPVPLKAGQMSLHNTHTVHASGPAICPTTAASDWASAISRPMSAR